MLINSTIKISVILVSLSLLVWLGSGIAFDISKDEEQRTERIQKQIVDDHLVFIDWKENSINKINQLGPDFWELNELNELHYDEKGYSLFIYEGAEVKYWSNSLTIIDITSIQNGIVQLNNGWFIVEQVYEGPYHLVFLLQITEEFATPNQYLQSHFYPDNSNSGEIIISLDPVSNHSIKLKGLQPFYLDYSRVNYSETALGKWNALSYFLFIASFFFLIFFLFEFRAPPNSKGLSFLVVFTLLILLRLVWLNNPFPAYLHSHPLFDPSIFAQSFLFPSLGDLLINAMLILLFVMMFVEVLKTWDLSFKENRVKGFALLFLILNLLWVFGLNFLLEGLVKNSRIPFNIDHLFELDTFSIIAMIAIAILFFAYYRLLETMIRFLQKNGLLFSHFILFGTTLYAVYAAVLIGLGQFDLTEAFWSLPILLAIAIKNWYSESRFGLGIGIFNLALFSLFLAHVFEKYNTEKEHAIRQVIGERIAQMQDPLKEIKLDQLLRNIQNSEWINQLFLQDSISSSELSEIEVFFSNDWFRYSKSFTKEISNKIVFNVHETTFIDEDPVVLQNTLSKFVRFFHDENRGVGYAFSVPIISYNDTLGFLQGIFTERSTPISSGFPQLLRSETNYIQSYASEYSYARYFNERRIYSTNEEEFPVETAELTDDLLFEGFTYHNQTSILIMPEEYGFRWMIGRPIPQLFQKVTTFSYLFLFMGFLSVLLLIGQRLLQSTPLFYFSLRSKIQLIFISFSIVILTLYAFVIFDQITQQFHHRNMEQITERLNSIHIELGHKLGDFSDLDDLSNNRLYSYLLKFSEVFVSDISLFDLDGRLIASSSSLIWDKKLLSMQIDPVVYNNVSIRGQSRFIQEESIGSFTYLSGYRPLYNNLGKKIAYLNVPYFARQDELIRELNRFLQALINVFVLLMGISVIVAIYVSSWITSPLKLLQKSFSSLDLIKRNQPIKYTGNDEIASLVKAYNLKVSELEKLTEQIVQSEKEYAWQEMARQVAHEIKNPLTPMRLSIQHYQRLLESNPEVAIEKTPSLMKALIEQVDNLNHIANEFSRFAQISVSKQTEFDLGNLINEVFELYAHIDGVSVSKELADDCNINADKGQVMRMLNNLIQNAIQATKKEELRRVSIRLIKNESNYTVEVEDNGMGIAKELENKIFKPNFTTKSKGMGLGLAIVHTIVNNHNGVISFRNAENKGTVFVVELPIA